MDTIFAVAARLQSMNLADDLLLILVKATLILLIARLLLAAMPRASAATKHLVATATLVAVACMPLLSVVVPAWQVAVTRRVVPAAVTQNPAPEQKTIGLRDDENVGIARSLAAAIAPEPVSLVTRAASVVSSTWKGFFILAIALTALGFLGHMLAGMMGVWFVARNARELENDDALLALDEVRGQLGLRADVRLLQSPRVTVPVVWGVFRPVLLLPEDAASWPTERMRVVLLHELAHLKRVDGVSLILTRIAVSLFWFHPLAWSLERAGRNECERACDDLVLATGTRPSDYADHLLDIARTMPAFDPFRAVTLAMSRKSQLEGRLLSILQPGVARRVFSGRGVAIACALAVAVIIPVSALRLIAQQPEKPKEQVTKEQVKRAQASGSSVDVRPEIETLADYFEDTFSAFDKKSRHKELSDRAFDLYKADRFTEAGDAFRRAAAEDEDGPNATALYNAACSYALANDAARATEALNDALGAGWDDFEKIAEDSDFDAIRGDSRFVNLLGRYGSDVATRRLNYTVDRYNQMRSSRTASSDDWFEVGTNLLSLRRLDESLDALQHSLQSGEKHSATLYNIACVHSLRGDLDAAVTYLDKAIEDGYGDEEHMQQDRDLAQVRGHARFGELLKKANDLELRNRSWDRTWREAAAWHKRMLDKYPDSGRAWFNYGYTSLQARDYESGIAAFQRTLAMKYRPATSAYNIACAYALQDNRDAAFQWLERAQASGFDLREKVMHDEDLDSLRDDPRWRGLVGSRVK